ncbi:hypothetical protein OW701_04590 [Acinetobacter baumannii]|uniref:hypothetical protein n=1 Tax=Acinetobacter baumannii TaxID=470 RepID=UPI0023411C0A|nr:hypothetical protein [Acinetobacter baumannii]MCZ3008653.1 hypothetical protein [Acinetobacter baumannii]MDC5359356.1 hypothetical protein [Acinetobacter baumannii]MDK2184741.1 hypothetical protein [Acinetobacter baumannii]MDK2257550.1 hypothetical protein [Acinetobacter baumannii]MDK2264417.1 hypothetical protein [Acinetobacter baumannii]
MPLPVILWGAAAALGATGVFKGAKAIGNLKEAKEIGNDAESKYGLALDKLEKKKEKTNSALEELGRLKLNIFTRQIKHTIDVIKKSKDAGGKLENFESSISIDELKEMEAMVLNSLKLEAGLLAGTTGGALAGLGAYSSVGLLASASTGTAISGLSGVAATNATLAWLGGGSLASGGFGMAGGMVALGGIVAGPALAIGGFMLASKAEEALTKAIEYAAEVDEAVEELDLLGTVLKGIQKNVKEVTYTLNELVQRFESMKVNDDSDPQAFKQMIANTKILKDLLDCRIIDEEGSPIKNIKHTCQGFLKI